MIEIFTMIYITIMGAIMGSFLGCMGYRIPNKIKLPIQVAFVMIVENHLNGI